MAAVGWGEDGWLSKVRSSSRRAKTWQGKTLTTGVIVRESQSRIFRRTECSVHTTDSGIFERSSPFHKMPNDFRAVARLTGLLAALSCPNPRVT